MFNKKIFFFILLIIISTIIRILFIKDWLSYDECQHFLVAKSPFIDNFFRESFIRAHPPLTYALMKPFVWFGSSAYLAKMLSFLSGILSVAIVYIILIRLNISALIAFVGALLISTVPVFVDQSVEVRQYSLCLVFIFISIFIFIEIYDNSNKLRYNILLALICFFALITEYGAFFHVGALLFITLILFIKSNDKGKIQKKIIIYSVPYLFILFLALFLFYWHFRGQVPVYGHTRDFTYDNSLSDLSSLWMFISARFLAQMNGILPFPWGAGLFILILLPFTPLVKGHPLAGLSRYFALYSLISLGAVCSASLLGKYPFGGIPRHTAVIVPGMMFAALLTILTITEKWFKHRARRTIVSIVVVILCLAGVSYGNFKFERSKETYRSYYEKLNLDEYFNNPSPIVANWRGKNIASWWFLPRTCRLIASMEGGSHVYDYEGIELFQSESREQILEKCISYAMETGECWIVLASLQNPPNDIFSMSAFLKKELKENNRVKIIDCSDTKIEIQIQFLRVRRCETW